MASGLHESADTARDLAHTIEKGADALDKASQTTAAVAQKVERVTDKAASARDAVTERARAHPLAAVGVAVAVGFVLGRR